jgi:hypothetical protein
MTKNSRGTYLHYLVHFFIASAGLYFVYVQHGSITIWEILLYYIGSYLPLIDECIYATLNYINSDLCRTVMNYFFVGNIGDFVSGMHEARDNFLTLTIHNIFAYIALWAMWYGLFIFDIPVGLYFMSGVLVHLLYDMVNDQYEFGHCGKWFWPFTMVLDRTRNQQTHPAVLTNPAVSPVQP